MASFHKRTMTNDVCNEKSALLYTTVSKRTRLHCFDSQTFLLQMVLWIVYDSYILHLNILILRSSMDTLTWTNGHEHMDMATQTWTHGHKHMDMDTWIWTHGHGHGQAQGLEQGRGHWEMAWTWTWTWTWTLRDRQIDTWI
jgi:hypothetical protein